MITWLKKANNFQITKVQPQGVFLRFCLIFCQLHSGVAYEVFLIKKRVFNYKPA